jgi:hypothetical protein
MFNKIFYLNKKGDEKLFFLFLMGVVFILALILVGTIVSFLRLDSDIRSSQANLISLKVVNCFKDNPSLIFLSEEEMKKEFSNCGVALDIFEDTENFCVLVQNEKGVVFRSCSKVFETNCLASFEGILNERKSASCYEKILVSSDSKLNNLKVLIGIFPKGGKK